MRAIGRIETYRAYQPAPGERVEYIGEPVFDGIIWTGDFGRVTRVEGGWVHARWPGGSHSVPVESVRPAPPRGEHRVVTDAANARIWGLFGDDTRFRRKDGGETDPYLSAGSHPDVVERVWKVLGQALPADCRARANGTPVLAHPKTNRIFAAARGSRYALWLTPPDFQAASAMGAKTLMTWSGGRTTDLAEVAGPGWIWGRWYAPEPEWLRRSYEAAGGWSTSPS